MIHFSPLVHDGPWDRLFYGSLPGSILLKISSAVGKCQAAAPAWTRFIAEKPFGNDLASAKEFDANILAAFNEEQVAIPALIHTQICTCIHRCTG